MNLKLFYIFTPVLIIISKTQVVEAKEAVIGQKDLIKQLLDKKGSKHQTSRKIALKMNKTNSDQELNLEIEGGPSILFKRKPRANKGHAECIFAGQCAINPENCIIISQCKHFKAGLIQIEGESFNVDMNDETVGTLDDDIKIPLDSEKDEISLTERGKHVRKWNAKHGRWEVKKVTEEDLHIRSEIVENDRVKRSIRKKRGTTSAFMQLGVYVDEALWKQFSEKYGETAEEAVSEWADYMVDHAELYFSRDLTTPVSISLAKLEIWKEQPVGIDNTIGYDMGVWLDEVTAYIMPKTIGLDNAVVFSGLELSGAAGMAWVSQLCTNSALAVANADVNTHSAYVMAHEIGHNVGMSHSCFWHNGCAQCKIQEGQTWTACSDKQFEYFLSELDDSDSNCLRDEFIDEPLDLDNYPGQRIPPHQLCQNKGRCYVHAETKNTAICDRLNCNTKGDISYPDIWFYQYYKYMTDGTYCGIGKICHQLECLTLDTSVGVLTPVNGGWSPEWKTDVKHCGGGCNAECKMIGQLIAEVEWRMCNNPYPLNGGDYCTGFGSRMKSCGDEEESLCTTGAPTMDAYKMNVCKESFGEVRDITDKTHCQFICWLTFDDDEQSWGYYRYMDDGIECGSGGRCLNRECVTQCLADPHYYTLLPNECPSYQWKLITKTGGDTTDGPVYLLIIGTQGMSDKILLDSGPHHFKSGATDTFNFETEAIGDVVEVQFGIESTNGWFMEWAELTLNNSMKMWRFEFNSRLDGDYVAEVTLTPV